MMKGVSPVIAVVLLIAIAVIAAVAVWYWVAPLTGKPATIDYTQQKFAVQRCYKDTDIIDLRSESGLTLRDINFDILYAQNGSSVCSACVVVDEIEPGETVQVNTSGSDVVSNTPYVLRSAQGIPDIQFTCS